jgi:mRNA interferase MazF
VDLGLTAKVRPCVVVSTRIGDADRALVTLVPHTTSTRATTFEVDVQARFLKGGAFDAQGLVTVPPSRAVRVLGMLSRQQLALIERAIAVGSSCLAIKRTEAKGAKLSALPWRSGRDAAVSRKRDRV